MKNAEVRFCQNIVLASAAHAGSIAGTRRPYKPAAIDQRIRSHGTAVKKETRRARGTTPAH